MADNKVVIKINIDKTEAKKNESPPKMVTQWHVGRIIGVSVLLLLILVIIYLLTLSEESPTSMNKVNVNRQTPEPTISVVDAEEANQKVAENNEESEREIKPVETIDDIEQRHEIQQAVDIISQSGMTSLLEVKQESAEIPGTELNKREPAVDFGSAEVDENNAFNVIETGNNEIEEGLEKKREAVIISTIYDEHISRSLLTHRIIDKEPSGEVKLPIVADKNKAIAVFYFTEINNMKGNKLFHHWMLNGRTVFKRKLNILGKHWRASTSKLITYSGKGHWQVKLTDNEGNILSLIAFDVI